jgi:hypothetical protein
VETLDDSVLDGNAIGGLLMQVFRTEMTTAVATCGSCGTASEMAELPVYLHSLGTVVRCRHCVAILMTFVEIRGITCVDLAALASLET